MSALGLIGLLAVCLLAAQAALADGTRQGARLQDVVQHDLGLAADHFLDRTGTLTIREVSSAGSDPFNRSSGRYANYGPRPNPEAVLWLRSVVPVLPDAAPAAWTLVHPELRVRRATLYTPSQEGWITTVWNGEDHANAAVAMTRFPVFHSSAQALSGRTIYLRIETASSMRGFLTLLPADSFSIRYANQSAWFGIAIGLLGVLSVYLFATGLAAGDRPSLLLAAFAASYLTYLVSHQGFLETLLWPGSLQLSRVLSLSGTCLIFATRLFFVDAFLDMAAHRPLLSRVTRGLGWFFVIIAVVVGVDIWLNGQTFLRRYTSMMGVGSLLMGIFILLAMVTKTPRRVGLYVLCWFPMLAAGLTRLLHDAAPGLGVHVLSLNATYVLTCICFVVSGVVTGGEMHRREKQRRIDAEVGRQRLRDMALSTSDSFWETDSDGKLTLSTGPTGVMAGLEPGQPLLPRLDGLDAAGAREIGKAMVDRAAFQQRILLRDTANGRRRILEVRGRPFGDAISGWLGYRGVLADITTEVERQNAEAQQQKLAAVGQLAGGVAHEINNLLHPIINLSRRASADLPARDERKRWLEVVVDSASRAAEIVTSLLATVRPASSATQPVPLREGVERAINAIRAVTPQGITLEFSGDGSAGPTLLPHEAFQLVVNLVSNAVHATQGNGTITVRLDATTDDSQPSHVVLSVEDDGTGMDTETSKRALEPFFSLKAEGEGTGLGLSIVHSIVQRLGGSIAITSKPGEGTRVDVRLPMIPLFGEAG